MNTTTAFQRGAEIIEHISHKYDEFSYIYLSRNPKGGWIHPLVLQKIKIVQQIIGGNYPFTQYKNEVYPVYKLAKLRIQRPYQPLSPFLVH